MKNKKITLKAGEQKGMGAICGGGMCPYVPCVDYPHCEHIQKVMEEEKEHKKIPKRWLCCVCNNHYCFIKSAIKHNIKKHEGKAMFKDLKEINLKY